MSVFSDIVVPEGGFKVIYVDNPWQFKTFSKKGLDGRPQHYKRMTLKEIKALPVLDLAAKDCHLFLWTSAPFLEQAFEVLKAWGFKYSSRAFLWVKLNPTKADTFIFADDTFCFGPGYTTRSNPEDCLLARRGKPKRNSKSVRELMFAARREHSRKPDETIRRIEQYADGPYLELFARTTRKNWTTWGNETDKFDTNNGKEE